MSRFKLAVTAFAVYLKVQPDTCYTYKFDANAYTTTTPPPPPRPPQLTRSLIMNCNKVSFNNWQSEVIRTEIAWT